MCFERTRQRERAQERSSEDIWRLFERYRDHEPERQADVPKEKDERETRVDEPALAER